MQPLGSWFHTKAQRRTQRHKRIRLLSSSLCLCVFTLCLCVKYFSGMNILSEIIATKRERVSVARKAVPPEQMRHEAEEVRHDAKTHALRTALRFDGINIIAEFKRRSPSKGTIRAGANLTQIVQSYEAGGAVAL